MTAPRPAGRLRWLVRGALIALLLAALGLALLWFTLPDPVRWATRPPTTTALIEQRRAEARAAGRRFQPSLQWVPLERLSRRLVDAVVAAEDATFFQHHGFDWEALGVAFRQNLRAGRYARGASTITQQLAKNLALGTEKSLLRKAREALLTVRLERRLDKRRLLALYLNVAEWGDGAFGAEAGARRHFSIGATSLSTAQAVLLAAMLPAPRRATLAPAPGWLAARARGLLQRLGDERVIPAGELPEARLELERYLGAPAPPPGPAEEPPADEPEEVPAAAPSPPAEPAEPAEPPAPTRVAP
jgi:monofunctional biosynthetic peptidoglycan transglycosylase